MNVLDQQKRSLDLGCRARSRRALADGRKEFVQVMERAVADLLGVMEKITQMRAGGKIQPEELPDEMGMHDKILGRADGRVVAAAQQTHQAMFKLVARNRGRIAFLNYSKPRGKDIAHQREGQARPLGGGTATEKADDLRQQFHPFLKFDQQARFADTGVTDYRDNVQLTIFQDALKG